METTKRCHQCYKKSTVENFGKNNSNKDALDNWCKQCRRSRQDAYKNGEPARGKYLSAREIKATTGVAPIMGKPQWDRLRKKGTLAANLRTLYIRPGVEQPRRVYTHGGDRKAETAAAIRALKMERGCIECGYRAHSEALHFDHLPTSQKSFNIARAKNMSWGRVMEEIAKCEVVCANCHAVRTYARREAKDLI